MHDNVNSPKHYVGHTSLECIDVMCALFGKRSVCIFCLCNAFKYMWRHKFKNGEEDLAKAKWYLDWVSKYPKLNTDSRLMEDYEHMNELYNRFTE